MEKIYFAATTSSNGREVMVYDPNQPVSGANPQVLGNIAAGTTSSNPKELVVFQNKLYFAASGSSSSTEIYIYDDSQPTVIDTNPLLVNMPGINSDPIQITVVGDYLLWSGGQAGSGYDLFVYDPSQTLSIGTNPAFIDIIAGSGSSLPLEIFNYQGTALMTLATASNGTEMAVFDPSQPVTSSNPLIIDSQVGAFSGYPNKFFAFDGLVYLSGEDPTITGDFYFSAFDMSQPIDQWGTNNPSYIRTDLSDSTYHTQSLIWQETVVVQ